jgi:hypothetical protein
LVIDSLSLTLTRVREPMPDTVNFRSVSRTAGALSTSRSSAEP